MSDIFQEVDEEVRRDKAAEFWAKYQNVIFALAALIIVGTAGYRFYEYRQLAGRASRGRRVPGRAETRSRRQGLGGPGGARQTHERCARRAIACSRASPPAAEQAKSDPKAGAASFDALANDGALDPLFREAARLRAALARLDAGDPDAAKGALEVLAAPTGVFRKPRA